MRQSVFIALTLLLCRMAYAQEVGRITVGSGSATIGSEVRIPIYINLQRPGDVRRVQITIAYPGPSMAFNKAEPSESAKHSVSIKAKATADEERNTSNRLDLVIEASERKTIPSGLIAALWFHVPKHAKPGIFPMRLLDARASKASRGTQVQLRGDNGSVTIYEDGGAPGVVACFFYMH